MTHSNGLIRSVRWLVSARPRLTEGAEGVATSAAASVQCDGEAPDDDGSDIQADSAKQFGAAVG